MTADSKPKDVLHFSRRPLMALEALTRLLAVNRTRKLPKRSHLFRFILATLDIDRTSNHATAYQICVGMFKRFSA